MKSSQHFLICLFVLLCSLSFGQQILVEDGLTPEELIQNHLISGCVEASNITSPINGEVNNLISYGFFERANSNFPFENGIVLSSGEVSRVGNEQNNSIITSGNNEWGTDPAVEEALGIGNTFNATTIQFNFSSISDRIEFNYILASEEYYANFPCAFSDGFAFLIRRAGTNDPYQNIAIIPGTDTPVNTTTIRPEISGFCDAQNEEYFAGFNMGDTNFNGRTEVLTAVVNIEPYEVYEIKLIVADQNDTNYDSAVFIEGNSFGSTIDLGQDIQTCASQVLLDGSINNPNAEYSWYLDETLISEASDPSYSATVSGTYTVEASIPINNTNCILSDEINVIIDSAQTAESISDFVLCDSNGNGLQNFNLNDKRDEITDALIPSDYNISFHTSLNDAQLNNNSLADSFNNSSNPQTIYVRVEDASSGCLIYSTFNLIVSALPTAAAPDPISICAPAELNGQTVIDLNALDLEITGGDDSLEVTYHSTLSDAENGANPLISPYVNTTRNETIFISVYDQDTGCRNTNSFLIEITDQPDLISGSNLYLNACDQDHDGNAIFDLTSISDSMVQNPNEYEIQFYETFDDAEVGANPIVNEQAYANTESNEQVIYVRIESTDTGCFTIAPLELHTDLLLTATNIRNIDACDEDGDGYEEFNLNAIEQSIINDLPGVSVTFHLTEEDRNNELNPINTNEVFINSENPQTIYLNLYSNNCSDIAEFIFTVNPIIDIQTIDKLYVCDVDDDGLSTFDLQEFDEAVTQGNPEYSVSYFATQLDADQNTNALPRFYENTSNPFTLYPRISSPNIPCITSNSFEVIVNLAPETNALEELMICDEDQDGFFEIDLTTYIPEVMNSVENLNISFHHSLSDAETNTNAIVDTVNYNAQTETVFLRVENNETACYSIEELQIVVNTFPVIGQNGIVEQYLVCENASDGIAEFIFSTRDDEIIGSQTGKETSYYLSQQGAENGENPIDKNAPFVNSTNPQTIFVRLQNTSDNSCYETGSFEIFVSTNPNFNTPTNIFLCDDMSNDESEVIDFASKTIEITNGHSEIESVTYHLSEADAINGVNNLPDGYQNTINPQEIFARIDNGTDCQSITSFVFTVLQAPSVSLPEPLMQCDVNADGFEIFDLTASEFDIFDIRQNDIVVSYHSSFSDAENGSNTITNPESYNHNTSGQFVYIRVTNTVSNCYEILPLEIIINPLPVINDFRVFNVCLNEEQNVDLNSINPIAIDDISNMIISYHTSEDDALSNTNPLEPIYYYTETSEDLYIRVQDDETGCFNTYNFQLEVSEPPRAYQPNFFELCDDDYDGMLVVDLSELSSTIMGGQNSEVLNVSYHLTELEASTGENPLDLNYQAMDGDIIYARVFNINTGCWDSTYFYILINPLPVFNIGDQVVCTDNLPLYISANTGTATDTYQWSTGATTPDIEIIEVGEYWVTVTTEDGCSATEIFNVSASESATIEFTEVLDFSDPNNISITVSGIGDYLYILDDGEPQESNVFEHVSLGYHTITIIDVNGCTPITKEVLVIDAPKFFTPNGDGQFDTWHIVGIETLPGTEIYIYDRYGKLLKTLLWNSQGWNGKYRGNELRSDDYWYKAFVKRGEISMEVSGHFALRR